MISFWQVSAASVIMGDVRGLELTRVRLEGETSDFGVQAVCPKRCRTWWLAMRGAPGVLGSMMRPVSTSFSGAPCDQGLKLSHQLSGCTLTLSDAFGEARRSVRRFPVGPHLWPRFSKTGTNWWTSLCLFACSKLFNL